MSLVVSLFQHFDLYFINFYQRICNAANISTECHDGVCVCVCYLKIAHYNLPLNHKRLILTQMFFNLVTNLQRKYLPLAQTHTHPHTNHQTEISQFNSPETNNPKNKYYLTYILCKDYLASEMCL